MNFSEIKNFLAAAEKRRAGRRVTGGDLRRLSRVGETLLARGDAVLRAQFTVLLEELQRGGNIYSRIDSHYWDLGLCEIESGESVICAADGYILCGEFGGEESLSVYSPEEVREIGGAPSV